MEYATLIYDLKNNNKLRHQAHESADMLKHEPTAPLIHIHPGHDIALSL